MPDLLITGGDNGTGGPMNGLLGLKLPEQMAGRIVLDGGKNRVGKEEEK